MNFTLDITASFNPEQKGHRFFENFEIPPKIKLRHCDPVVFIPLKYLNFTSGYCGSTIPNGPFIDAIDGIAFLLEIAAFMSSAECNHENNGGSECSYLPIS